MKAFFFLLLLLLLLFSNQKVIFAFNEPRLLGAVYFVNFTVLHNQSHATITNHLIKIKWKKYTVVNKWQYILSPKRILCGNRFNLIQDQARKNTFQKKKTSIALNCDAFLSFIRPLSFIISSNCNHKWNIFSPKKKQHTDYVIPFFSFSLSSLSVESIGAHNFFWYSWDVTKWTKWYSLNKTNWKNDYKEKKKAQAH